MEKRSNISACAIFCATVKRKINKRDSALSFLVNSPLFQRKKIKHIIIPCVGKKFPLLIHSPSERRRKGKEQQYADDFTTSTKSFTIKQLVYRFVVSLPIFLRAQLENERERERERGNHFQS